MVLECVRPDVSEVVIAGFRARRYLSYFRPILSPLNTLLKAGAKPLKGAVCNWKCLIRYWNDLSFEMLNGMEKNKLAGEAKHP